MRSTPTSARGSASRRVETSRKPQRSTTLRRFLYISPTLWRRRVKRSVPGILLDGRCGNLAVQPARRQAAGAERVRQCGGMCRCSLKSAASIYFKLIPATGDEARTTSRPLMTFCFGCRPAHTTRSTGGDRERAATAASAEGWSLRHEGLLGCTDCVWVHEYEQEGHSRRRGMSRQCGDGHMYAKRGLRRR